MQHAPSLRASSRPTRLTGKGYRGYTAYHCQKEQHRLVGRRPLYVVRAGEPRSSSEDAPVKVVPQPRPGASLDGLAKPTQVVEKEAPGPLHAEGFIFLLFVAILWGTYPVALRYAYTLPGGPTPLVLTALRGLMQVGLLLVANLLFTADVELTPAEAAEHAVEPLVRDGTNSQAFHRQPQQQQQQQQQQQHEEQPRPPGRQSPAGDQSAGFGEASLQQQGPQAVRQGADLSDGQLGSLLQRRKQAQSVEAEDQQETAAAPQQQVTHVDGFKPAASLAGRLRVMVASLPPAVLGGMEIGLYNTLGTTTQAVGLAYTTATRGSLLIQATSIFTPILVAALGDAPRPSAWAGSVIALAGALLVASEGAGSGGGLAGGGEGSTAGGISPLGGDALTILAALCYSLSVVRIGAYAKQVAPLQLALGKSAMLAVVSAALLSWEAASVALKGEPLTQLWPNPGDPVAWAVVAYSAVGPGALAAYFHVKGQSLVSPTEAQILFSTVPLWSILFVTVALGGEGGGLSTWLGGGAMAVAGVVAAL